MGWIDYWCNAFTPDRSPLWDASLAEQGTPLVLRSDPLDSFAEPDVMAERMSERGVDTLVLPTCDLPPNAGVSDFETFAARPEEARDLATRFPGPIVVQPLVRPRHVRSGCSA